MSEVDPHQTRTYRNVKVTLSNISALERQNLVVMEPQQVTVNIQVSGKKSDLDRFSPSSINANVDLSGYSEGQVRVPVVATLSSQTSGVSISDVEPREILFSFDRLVTKEMPLRINTTGELAENYVLGDLTSRSQFVLVSGPRTWINHINQVIATVDLSNRITTTTETFATLIVDDEGNEVRGVTKEPNLVDITIPVFRTVALPIELITINELPANYSVTNINISPSTIRVKGSKDITKLQKIETVEVDINKLLDKSAFEVDLNLPEGIELLDPNEKVTIIYNIEETTFKEFRIPVRDLNILNLDNKLEIDENDLDQLVRINLSGYKSLLDNLNPGDLNVSIDLGDAREGNYIAQVNIGDIQGVTIQSINPQSLNLRIIGQ